MQNDGWNEARKVALVGIPDDALDVLNYYTQSSEWEPRVVVSASQDAYAVRMARVLGVPIREFPEREELAACDLVIVGDDAPVSLDDIRALLADTGVEVADLSEVSGHLDMHPFQELVPETPARGFELGDIDSALGEFGPPSLAEEPPVHAPVEEPTWESEEPASHEEAYDRESRPEFEPAEEEPESQLHQEPEFHAKPEIHHEPELHPEPAEAAPAEGRPTGHATGSGFDLTSWFGRHDDADLSLVPIAGDSPELESLLDEVLASTGAETGSVMLPDADGEHLSIAASRGLPPEVVRTTHPLLGEGLAGKAFLSGTPSVLAAEVPRFAEAGEVSYRLAASIPLTREGRRLGVLSVNIDSEERLDETAVLEALGAFREEGVEAVLRSIDFTRLAPETKRSLLYRELDGIMSADASFPERLQEVAEALRRAVGADYYHLYLVDPLSQRLELISPARGLSSTEGRYLSLDQGLYSWIIDRGRIQLLTADDPEHRIERAVACLPVRASRPYGLLVLEHFPVRADEKDHLMDLLGSVLTQIEELFEIEQGVESQDVLAGLRMRITDKRDELEFLPEIVRTQPVLEFGLQILAAEAAIWVERPGARPVIAQPQTRQAARIVADAWDSLEILSSWVSQQGSVAWGGSGQGWDPGAPGGPAPYVGIRDEREGGVLLVFFSDRADGGPSAQMPARILLEALGSLCEIIPLQDYGDGKARGRRAA